jgi:hypothetical protein
MVFLNFYELECDGYGDSFHPAHGAQRNCEINVSSNRELSAKYYNDNQQGTRS